MWIFDMHSRLMNAGTWNSTSWPSYCSYAPCLMNAGTWNSTSRRHHMSQVIYIQFLTGRAQKNAGSIAMWIFDMHSRLMNAGTWNSTSCCHHIVPTHHV